jgi:hypothetical protein
MNSRRLVIGSIRRYASPNTIGRVARRNFTTARSQNRNLSLHRDVVTRLAPSFTDDHLEHGRAVFGDASDFDHIDLLRGARLPQNSAESRFAERNDGTAHGRPLHVRKFFALLLLLRPAALGGWR